MNDIISTICHDRHIKLTDVATLDEAEFKTLINRTTGRTEDFIECSHRAGNSEIILGKYSDENRRLASFFHELGHMLLPEKYKKALQSRSILGWEIECWNTGLNYAFKKFDIVFDEETIKWAYDQAMTYYHYK